MHTYQGRWPDDHSERVLPRLFDFRFSDALDVARYAELDQVDESDAHAFLDLRQGLARHGITLLDVMVFDQEFHWWSLHELTSGTTRWL
jgi:hypothetical protein